MEDGGKEKFQKVLDIGYNSTIKYESRVDWGAMLPKQSSGPLRKPATHVRLTTTRSSTCWSREECSKTVRKLQNYHMDNGRSDIPHSFMIGGDLAVYEGRGFFWNPLFEEEYGELNGKIIDVALIGSFTDLNPPEIMMSCAIDLITCFILKSALIAKFGLVPLPKIREPMLPLFDYNK